VQCYTPIVSATWETEAGGSLEPRAFEISLGNIVRSSLKKIYAQIIDMKNRYMKKLCYNKRLYKN
jgi:hypothetical protein